MEGWIRLLRAYSRARIPIQYFGCEQYILYVRENYFGFTSTFIISGYLTLVPENNLEIITPKNRTT